LEDTGEPRVQQQVELPTVPVTIEQHDFQPQRCAHCEKVFSPQVPEDMRKAGLFGPRLTALVGFLKGPCHMSFSAIRKYFRDVIGVRVSRGMLSKLVRKVSDSLLEPYEALLAMLPDENRLNVDETGHKENGKGELEFGRETCLAEEGFDQSASSPVLDRSKASSSRHHAMPSVRAS